MLRIIGAIFIKLGRAPATQRMGEPGEYWELVFIILSCKRQPLERGCQPGNNMVFIIVILIIVRVLSGKAVFECSRQLAADSSNERRIDVPEIPVISAISRNTLKKTA